MDNNEEKKAAYPYITEFKKEPFQSFALIEKEAIRSFYFSKDAKLLKFFEYFETNLFDLQSLSLRKVYWFLMLKKYLRHELSKGFKERLYDYIQKCEIHREGVIGFRASPYSKQKKGDIRSTYYAIISLYLMRYFKFYLASKGHGIVMAELKSFIECHDKGNRFVHCLEKGCEICDEAHPARTLYYVLELLTLLGFEVRAYKTKYSVYIGKLKERFPIFFQLLCLKYFDLDHSVEEEFIQFLYGFQREDGGFSVEGTYGDINLTFWITNVLENYTWLLDYNPSGIYSFINTNLNRILTNKSSWNFKSLIKGSKLIIILSLIWNKFIEEIERAVFRAIEEKGYIDIKHLNSLFEISKVLEEILSYINLSYTFNLKILYNHVEFKNYLRNLPPRDKILAEELYERLSKKSIVSLSDIIERYNTVYPYDEITIKEFRPLIQNMIDNHYFEGEIKSKKKYLFFTKYFFYLDFMLDKIIVSDTKLNSERIFEEKRIQKEIKNDIYNMTLRLKNIAAQIEEEIESYLLIDELEIAKKRLKFIIRNALMESDFLNENIENSFNEDLYYISIHATLHSEIEQWNHVYSILSKKLKEIDTKLKEKISEKEDLRKYDIILDELDGRLKDLENHFNKRIDGFRSYLRETLKDGYSKEKLNLILERFNGIVGEVKDYDEKVYKISQKITLRDEKLNQKHKNLISYWISIKSELKQIFKYYSDGLAFFKNIITSIKKIHQDLSDEITVISKSSHQKVQNGEFQDAFKVIKRESEVMLHNKLEQIQELQQKVKNEIKSRQKLYILYKHLHTKLEKKEEEIIDIVAEEIQSIESKVIEERNRLIIEKFDEFVSVSITDCRKELLNYKKELDKTETLYKIDINDVKKGFNSISDYFKDLKDSYSSKLDKNRALINNFDEKSNLTIMQWERFEEYIKNEVKKLKEEYVNNIINEKIRYLAKDSLSNCLSLKKVLKYINIDNDDALHRIEGLINLSKLNGEILEKENCILVYTKDYYKNKELRNYINNKILKYKNKTIGKTLALYDSCIKNRTLKINVEEISSRIEDLKNFDTIMEERFDQKVKELNIDIHSKKEYKETLESFKNIIKNSKKAIENIKKCISTFKALLNYINDNYNGLDDKFANFINIIEESIETSDSYKRSKEELESNKKRFEELHGLIQETVLEKIDGTLEREEKLKKLSPELHELFVRRKNEFLQSYNKKIEDISQKLMFKRSELFRDGLLSYIKDSKIKLNQLLGKLQTRIEDYIEINEFQRAYLKIDEKIEAIDSEINIMKNEIREMIKAYNKETKNNFETKNKYPLEEFNKYLTEYRAILTEKTKSLKSVILESFIQMAIKGVTNEFLTVSFIAKELNGKRKEIRNLILPLASEKLKGRYEPMLDIYYENPEVLDKIDKDELEVIKSMNYKLYIFLNRLKSLAKNFGPIIAFFASFLTLSFYLLQLTNWHPMALIIPGLILTGIIYFIFKKKKEAS